jgi:hypothetical protein
LFWAAWCRLLCSVPKATNLLSFLHFEKSPPGLCEFCFVPEEFSGRNPEENSATFTRAASYMNLQRTREEFVLSARESGDRLFIETSM